MSRIYLAARYSRRLELVSHAADLAAVGHEVTSRWLAGDHQWSAPGLAEAVEVGFAANDNNAIPAEAYRFAADDLEDVGRSEVVVSFTERPRDPGVGASRGGRHVEFGLAYAWRKRLIVVGWKENVFHLLPEVEFCETWADALALLTPTAVHS